MSWSSNDRWKDGSWSIVSGESGFAHTAPIVDNQGSNIVVRHLVCSNKVKALFAEVHNN